MLILKLLILLVVANGAPVIAQRILGHLWRSPVDGGRRWTDGRRIFGSSKSWRGLICAVTAAAIVAVLLGYVWWFGAVFGALAMTGDLLSSFCKRRLGLSASDRARGLDQVPESLLPGLFAWQTAGLSPFGVVLLVVLFTLICWWSSPILYRLRIRRRPY